jgi:hypothetical protein
MFMRVHPALAMIPGYISIVLKLSIEGGFFESEDLGEVLPESIIIEG